MQDTASDGQSRISLSIQANEFAVAPGDYLTVPLSLHNRGPHEDNVTLFIDGIPANWVSTPASVTHLTADEHKDIPLTINPPYAPESPIGRYPLRVRIVSQHDPGDFAEAEVSLTVAAVEVQGRVGVLLGSSRFEVAPGESIAIPVILINNGLAADQFSVSAEGIPLTWVAATAPTTQLLPGEQKEVLLTIQPSISSQSYAGEYPLSIQVASQQDPDQMTQADTTLAVGGFDQFTSELYPERIDVGQIALVTVINQGNVPGIYTVIWQGQGGKLNFEPSVPQEIQVPPGQSASVEFYAEPRERPLIGGRVNYPFRTRVQSSSGETQTLYGQIMGRALIPGWAILATALLTLCIALAILFSGGEDPDEIVSATQTAVASETAGAALAQNPGDDQDGDGLSDADEAERGTDPQNPDTDGDGLSDGDEIARETDPLVPDTDGDGLVDGEEIRWGTDPNVIDSDGDTLQDGAEVAAGLSPTNVDTDGDGINDSADTDPGQIPTPTFETASTPVAVPPTQPLAPTQAPPDVQPTIPPPDVQPTAVPTAVVPPTAAPVVDPTAVPPAAAVTEVLPTATPGTADPPLQNQGLIVFQTNRDGVPDIYVYDSATQEVSSLTGGTGENIQPVWSPDGQQIVFTSNRDGNQEIYVMNADGTDQVNITNNAADDFFPTWSPDGEQIAFTTNRDGNQEIYVVNIDGANPVNLTNDAAEDFYPSWANPEEILFATNRDGNQEIYAMNDDGSSPFNLTENPADDFFPAGLANEGQIAFTTNRDGNQEVYVMSVDGENQTNVSNNAADDYLPKWSSAGQQIVFSTNRDGNQEVYVMNTDGADQVNVTNDPSDDLFAGWFN